MTRIHRCSFREAPALVTFSLEGAVNQRGRFPRQGLQDDEASCIDGALLFASLLEAASLSPAIVLVPGHAFIAWETWKQKNQWRFLETTMIGKATFEEACRSAETTAKRYQTEATQTKNPLRFRLRPLRSLRAIASHHWSNAWSRTALTNDSHTIAIGCARNWVAHYGYRRSERLSSER